MDVVIVLAPVVYGEKHTSLSILDSSHEGFDQATCNRILKQLQNSLTVKEPIQIKEDRKPTLPKQCPRLSPRENEVLMLIAKGFTHKEIARVLGLSPATVGGYKKEIYRKLAISSAAEATMEAIKYGLVSIDES